MKLARIVSAFSLALLIIGGLVHAAPQGAPRAAASQPAASAPAAPSAAVSEQDSNETREELEAILRRYPPSLGRVLKMDTSLLTNEAYLSSYPALASFLAIHSEVAHNPGYFLASVPGPDASPRSGDPKYEAIAMWRSLMDSIGVMFIFSGVTLALVWLVRNLLDWRRWTRLARVQAEVHTKLLDRFTSNEDLLAYVQTPAGRRFLESGPMLAEAGPRPMGAPVSRILWSAQAGIVLTAGGLGLEFASGRVLPEVGEGLVVLGVIAMAIGIGFVVSSAAAWLISRRMGLFEPIADRVGPGGTGVA